MLDKIKDKIFTEEEPEPEKIAKIKFSTGLKINHPLAKEIRLYENERLLDVKTYSDTILEEVDGWGFEIRDETMEDVGIFTHWEGGEMLLEDLKG